MIRRMGFSAVASAGLLALGLFGVAPVLAQGVSASFDCAKVTRTVDRFICAYAALRWQDLALSRSYTAAKAATSGQARDALIRSQRDWVRERDRRCVADRKFEELTEPSSDVQAQAYGCMGVVYGSQRRNLLDMGAKPLEPTGIVQINMTPVTSERPDILVGAGISISGVEISPDGAMLVFLLPSPEIDLPDQVWLYRVADGKLVAATPNPDREAVHPEGSPMAIHALAWSGDTLYARVALWSGDGESGVNDTTVYAATLEGSHRLDHVPADVGAMLDKALLPGLAGQEETQESDDEVPETTQSNHDFLVWTEDLGHGTMELGMRKRASGSPAYLVAWGSWELGSYLFDKQHSQLIYAADTGMSLFDMNTRSERRITGTSSGDRPYAMSTDQRVFVWATHNQCGDERMNEQDENEPERLCLAHLPGLDGATQPLTPREIKQVPVEPLKAAYPEDWEQVGYQVLFAPDKTLMALGVEDDAGDVRQVWLYQPATGHLTVASPRTHQGKVEHPEDIAAFNLWMWGQDGKFYLRTDQPLGEDRLFSADMSGYAPAPNPPPDIVEKIAAYDAGRAALPPDWQPPGFDDNSYNEQEGGGFIVWDQRLGHGSFELRAARNGDVEPRIIAHGGWELENFQFDPRGRRLFYNGEQGLLVTDPDTGMTRRVQGTRGGPEAIRLIGMSADGEVLVYSTKDTCGRGAADDVDADAAAGTGWRVCLAFFSATAANL